MQDARPVRALAGYFRGRRIGLVRAHLRVAGPIASVAVPAGVEGRARFRLWQAFAHRRAAVMIGDMRERLN